MLGLGGLVSFYGLVAIVSVFLDQKFGWGNQERLIIVAIAVITLPFALLITYFIARKRRVAEEDGASSAAAPESTPSNPATPRPADGLTQGIEEVVRFIKGSQGKGAKDALYSIPWYIVAGPDGSGKTSLLLGSNLDFQTLPSQRQSEQRVLRPTQTVEWRVTADAVFADTAGRFQSEGGGGDEWSSVLELIRSNRPARPIDGLILTMSVDRILAADERELEEAAKVMRARLDEAQQLFKSAFPVYLVFTHADSLEGFRDSFSVSKRDAQTLVWGTTFPFADAEGAHGLFDGEFEKLLNALMKRRLLRLSAPFAPVRQLRIFNFPLHFGSARRKFGTFVATLFRPNPFTASPVFRGFYLTATPAETSRPGSHQTAPVTGESFFSERWFRDVLLRDKDVARTFKENDRRPPMLGWTLTALGALLTLSLLVLSGVSLFNNKRLLDEAATKANVVLANVRADENVDVMKKDATAVRQELDAIEDLRAVLAELDENEREGAPFYLGFGLYSGDRIYREKLLKIYLNAIERRFKTPVVRKVEADLKTFAEGPALNPGRLTPQEEETLSRNYDLLKAYLMMSKNHRERANGSDIVLALKPYWKSEAKLPADLEGVADLQLEFWAKQVDREQFPTIMVDERAMVAAVRAKLKAFPPVFRYYKRRTTEISKQVDDKVGTMTVDAILARGGGDTGFMQGSYTVPGAYTLEGYKLMRAAIDGADKEIGSDDWVVGEEGRSDLTSATDAGRLEEKYFGDYTDHWRNFVRGVSVKPYTREGAKDALDSFASSRSSMRIVIAEIERNTNFSKAKDLGWFEYLKGLFSNSVDLDTGGNSQVEREFRPLFDFVKTSGGKDSKVPFDDYQTEIGLVAEKFRTFSTADINEIATMTEDARDKKFGQLKRSASKVEGMLKAFRDTPAGQALAELLGQPLGALNGLLGAGAKEQLARKWTGEIAAAAKEVERGFPFEDGEAEADMTKLKDFLNPADGRFSKFFDDNFKKDFIEEGGVLKVSETSRFQYTDEFVAYVNSLLKLRSAVFGKNPTPGFEYSFSLRAEGASFEATIDGQTVRSEAGSGSMNLRFPAQTGAESGVWLRQTGGDGGDVRKPGNWGLLRFVFDGSPKIQGGGDYLVTYSVGGKTVTASVKASGGDLFDRSIFKARAPQTIFK